MSPAEQTRCQACGADAVVNGTCARCGYASGAANLCPHCGAVARVESRGHGETLSWVCAVCGGPRVPGGFGGATAEAGLREARAFSAAAARARATAIAWGVLAALATLVVVAATAKAAIAASLVLAVFAVVPAVLALRARSRGEVATKAALGATEAAWTAAAEDVAKREPRGVTAEELAKKLQIDAVRADKLLTSLAVHERTRIDVGDDAEIRYSVEPPVRVAAEPDEETFAAAEGHEPPERQKRIP